MTNPTVFQRAEARIANDGTPKEYPIYHDTLHGVTASIDPLSRRPYGVVIYPHTEVDPGSVDHLWEGSLARTLRLQTVAHFVGPKILRAARRDYPLLDQSDLRARLRVDGREVPDHAHLVMAADSRTFVIPDIKQRLDEHELARRQAALAFSPEEHDAIYDALEMLERF
jgi:hypothetical protein